MKLFISDPRRRRALQSAFAEMQRAYAGGTPRSEIWAMNALERLLLLADQANRPGGHLPLDERVRAAMEHLSSHSIQSISLAGLAKLVHLSPSHLAHRFRVEVGLSPRRFLERERLERAWGLLLSTRLPVGQIAGRVGFANQFHFSTRFRKRYGVSPRQLRGRGEGQE